MNTNEVFQKKKVAMLRTDEWSVIQCFNNMSWVVIFILCSSDVNESQVINTTQHTWVSVCTLLEVMSLYEFSWAHSTAEATTSQLSDITFSSF